MTNIEKLDATIDVLKELHHEAQQAGRADLAKEYFDALIKMYDLMDKEIALEAIADDGWSDAEIRSMNGENL